MIAEFRSRVAAGVVPPVKASGPQRVASLDCPLTTGMLSRGTAAAELAQLAARQSSRILRGAHTGTEVVLREVVERLGEAGQRVTVNRGFARNHLVPNRLAVLVPKEVARRPPRSQAGGGASADATPMTSVSQLQLASVVKTLCSSPLELVRKPASSTVSGSGKLAKPVTAACISKEVMRQRSVMLAPQLLAMDQPLMYMGQHQVPLRLVVPSGEQVHMPINILNVRQPIGERVAAAAPALVSKQ